MITLKKSLFTVLIAILLLFLLGAGQAAVAHDQPDPWYDLPNWDIIIDDSVGMTLYILYPPSYTIGYKGGYLAPAGSEGHGFFEIKNMSPGGSKNTTITINSQCTFPVKLTMLVGCLKGVEPGRDDQGNPLDVILARQLDFETKVNGVVIPTFPDNKILTPASFLPANITDLFIDDGNYHSTSHVYYRGVNLGEYTFPTVMPLSTHTVDIDILLPGADTGNEYQGKTAQFVWIFKAEAQEPIPGDDDDEPGDTDADNERGDNDSDYGRDRTIDDPRTPVGGGGQNIPEPTDNIDEPVTPLGGMMVMPKTGEPPLWHSLLAGLTLVMLGMFLLLRKS